MRAPLFFAAWLFIFSLTGCGQKKNDKKEEEPGQFDSIIPTKTVHWVHDFEKILASSQVSYIDSLITKHEIETTNEIVIVTHQLDSVTIRSEKDFSTFSSALFNKRGVGKKDKNNGVGILISSNLRKVRIEVGLGLETKLTNDEAKLIIDTIMLPGFKKGDYYSGILSGLLAVIKQIK